MNNKERSFKIQCEIPKGLLEKIKADDKLNASNWSTFYLFSGTGLDQPCDIECNHLDAVLPLSQTINFIEEFYPTIARIEFQAQHDKDKNIIFCKSQTPLNEIKNKLQDCNSQYETIKIVFNTDKCISIAE